MDLYGIFACAMLWLCSVDGINAISSGVQWLQFKGIIK